MTNWDKVFSYWNATELGRKMIASDNVSNLELLFLIPNNKKKKLGLPLARVAKKGRKTRKYKRTKIRHIYSFSLFDLIEEVITKTLQEEWPSSEFFNDFVEIKDLQLGKEDMVFYEEMQLEDKPRGCHIRTYNTKDDINWR